ncbi:MAG: penicillin-binding protein activator LpoB [Candidatus Eisenbacteria bacterium]|nr:penicillin-binding protein activator LpoB [Candidatus Eisenbacteria bacterium]
MRGVMGTIAAALILGIALTGCGKSIEMERLDPTTDLQYNTKWSHVDNQKVADELVESMLNAPWIAEFTALNQGERPVVIVDDVKNATAEHIDVESLTDLIRTRLVKSQRVRFLNKESRDSILEEYKYQHSGVVDPSRAVRTGRQEGAMYILTGAIASIQSTLDKKRIVTYKTTLELTNLESAIIEWTDDVEMVKHFEARGTKF